MLKVLIVDDDKLVRKGFIHTMPWADFDMEVAGEANSGAKALEFLASHEVELLVTDLEMPGMSGIELMQKVKHTYPHIWMVVLTFHQEFDNIQQALRIGAIDYIAKVQLEQERMEEVLGRIASRIRDERKQSFRNKPPVSRKDSDMNEDNKSELVFAELSSEADLGELQQLPFVRTHPLTGIGVGLWLLETNDGGIPELDAAAVLSRYGIERHWAIIYVNGSQGSDKHERYAKLCVFKEHAFFYEYEIDRVVYEISADQLFGQSQQALAESDLNRLREGWSTLFWVADDAIFNDLLAETERLRPPVLLLESIFYSSAVEWRRIVPESAISTLASMRPFSFWAHVVDWLRAVRLKLRSKLHKKYSDEVLQSIMKAASYARQHFNEEMQLADATKQANMSRSYFSLCFKDIIGESFNDYVRNIRITHAQVLLRQTANPIYWVAEQCGYVNEKYFSRVFCERIGVLPSEYRQMPK